MHIGSVIKSCYCHLRSLGKLCPFLIQDAANAIAVSLIMSKLDFCNSTLWGFPANQLNHLQKIQNAAACIVTRTKSWDCITPVLYWLPVSKQIEYKILCLTCQCVHKTALQYLQELVSLYNPRVLSTPAPCADWTSQDLMRTQIKNIQEQGHSTMLHPPSGTGCQINFTKQKTLLLFRSS